MVAPWPAAIAPKYKALSKAWEFPLASLRFPPALVPTPEEWKAELTLTDLTPSHATEVPNLPPACIACMCVPLQLADGNPLGWSQFFKDPW